MAMPPLIKKILEMSEQLLWVPMLDKVTHRLSSENLDVHTAATPQRFGGATGTQYGHTALSSAVDSDLGENDSVAATPAAVKLAYDTASLLDSAYTTVTNSDGAPVVPSNLRSGGLLLLKED